MAKPAHTPQWTRLGPDERREQILEVAVRHFADRPYDAVSTIEIAAEAGVNRGLIHHYIGTKRELYLEVLRRTLHVPPFPPLFAGGHGELAELLARTLDAWLDEIEQNPEAWRTAQRAVGGFGRDPEVEQLVRDARDHAIDDAVRLMFDPADAPPAVRGLLSALGALALQAIEEWLGLGRLSRAQVHALLLSSELGVWENLDSLLAAGE